ncbi:MAG: putative quinol monooxygenase [Iamia sp.]
MIIIAGHYLVNEEQRDACVDAYRDLVSRSRTADGCIEVAITADSVDPGRINNLEVWRDADALDAWRARPIHPTSTSNRGRWRCSATTPPMAGRCSRRSDSHPTALPPGRNADG